MFLEKSNLKHKRCNIIILTGEKHVLMCVKRRQSALNEKSTCYGSHIKKTIDMRLLIWTYIVSFNFSHVKKAIHII